MKKLPSLEKITNLFHPHFDQAKNLVPKYPYHLHLTLLIGEWGQDGVHGVPIVKISAVNVIERRWFEILDILQHVME